MRASLGCDVVVVCVAAAWGALYLCVVLFCLLPCLLGYCCLAFDYDFVSPCLALPLYMYMSLCVWVCLWYFLGSHVIHARAREALCTVPALLLLSVHVCCCIKLHTLTHIHAQFSFVKFVSLKF